MSPVLRTCFQLYPFPSPKTTILSFEVICSWFGVTVFYLLHVYPLTHALSPGCVLILHRHVFMMLLLLGAMCTALTQAGSCQGLHSVSLLYHFPLHRFIVCDIIGWHCCMWGCRREICYLSVWTAYFALFSTWMAIGFFFLSLWLS